MNVNVTILLGNANDSIRSIRFLFRFLIQELYRLQTRLLYYCICILLYNENCKPIQLFHSPLFLPRQLIPLVQLTNANLIH